MSVLIVDDHAIFRADARELLEFVGYDVIAEASTAAEGMRQARALEPDVVLLDVQLPDGNGFDTAEEISSRPHPPRIVMVSSREAGDYGTRLHTSPAIGFIHKPELCRASIVELVGRPS